MIYGQSGLWTEPGQANTASARVNGCVVHYIPSTALDEKKAMFFVSRGFSLVHSGARGSASDSPVRELLSTYVRHVLFITYVV